MPMTENESRETVEIMLQYMSPREARAFALAMWQRIGSKTENASVRETLEGILALSQHGELPPVPKRVYVAWIILFTVHWAFALGNLASLIAVGVALVTSWDTPDWALFFPLATFIAWSATSRVYDCPFTRLDDALRQEHGLPLVKAFLRYYLIMPLRRAWRLESVPARPSTLAENAKSA